MGWWDKRMRNDFAPFRAVDLCCTAFVNQAN